MYITTTTFSRKFAITILIASTLAVLSACIGSLGAEPEEKEPEPNYICAGITHGYDREASKSDCLALNYEWIEGEGCYCGSGN